MTAFIDKLAVPDLIISSSIQHKKNFQFKPIVAEINEMRSIKQYY